MNNRGEISYAIATWFGCGFSPYAPGTAGSLAAIVIAAVLHAWLDSGRGSILILTAVLLIPGIWAAGDVAKREGREDPGLVVVDEVIGQWITLAGASVFNWKSYLAAFILFRALDVWKPPPARQFEDLHGGLGIVADDVMAGLYGALAIFLLDRFQIF